MSDLAKTLAKTLTELGSAGGQDFDPVRFRYISALLRKAERFPEAVAATLLEKASNAIERLQSDWENSQPGSNAEVNDSKATRVSPLADLNALTLQLLQHNEAEQSPSAESTLSDSFKQQEKILLSSLIPNTQGRTKKINIGKSKTGKSSHRELKSLASFRKSWEKLRADRVAVEVGQEAPENPGPLNQHMLVISTLTKMQELSPAYFKRYISYMESLMWVEHAGRSHKRKEIRNKK